MISLKDLKKTLTTFVPKLLGPAPDDMVSQAAYGFPGTNPKFDPPIWRRPEAERITSAVKRIPLEHPHWECSICKSDLRTGSIRSADVYYCFPCWDENVLKVKRKRPVDAHLGGVEV